MNKDYKYNFEEIVERASQGSNKWNRRLKMNADSDVSLPPFSVADLDFKYPKSIIEKYQAYIGEMVFGYTRPQVPYYDSIINWMKRRHHFYVKIEWIVDGNGVVPAIFISVKAFSDEGDGVMIMTPVYPPFAKVINDAKRKVLNIPLLNNDNRYTIDFNLLEEYAKKESTKVLVLCSPHNPVGRVWTKQELERINEICIKHNVIVIADEIHMDLIMPGYTHHIFASLNEAALNNSVILTSASKSFNIAGLQTSTTIIANKDLRDRFVKEQSENAFFGMNAVGFKLVEIMYEDGEVWLDELIELIEHNQKVLTQFIETEVSEVKVIPLEGTYLQWLDFRSFNMSDEDLFSYFYENYGLFLTSGKDYGLGGSGFLRWNIATPTTILQEGLERLRLGVAALNDCYSNSDNI